MNGELKRHSIFDVESGVVITEEREHGDWVRAEDALVMLEALEKIADTLNEFHSDEGDIAREALAKVLK